jgi:hypothetical protein
MITMRRTTLGRTPLDEGSARYRDLYLTTHKRDRLLCLRFQGRYLVSDSVASVVHFVIYRRRKSPWLNVTTVSEWTEEQAAPVRLSAFCTLTAAAVTVGLAVPRAQKCPQCVRVIGYANLGSWRQPHHMGVKLGCSHWGSSVSWGCWRIGCWVEYLRLRGTRWQKSGEKYKMRSLMICTLYPILFGW